MNTLKQVEAGSMVSRRHLLLGGAALAVVAAGGAGYYFWSQPGAGTARAPGEVPMADLMIPGPLGDQILGDPKAPVTIVEYASMTCPHCAKFHETVYPEMKRKYVDTGKVRFVFREFPLDSLAAAASVLARCAGNEKFFPLVETLFAQQQEWRVQKPLQPLFAIAQQAGFTQQSFDACLENQQILQGIEEAKMRAVSRFNVESTPTFFINGRVVRGTLTSEELDRQIASYLKG
jgi:protein-disulfide isomerase